jgi:hypothetical protein
MVCSRRDELFALADEKRITYNDAGGQQFLPLGPRQSNKKNKDKNNQGQCHNNQHLGSAHTQIRFAKSSKAFWTSVRVKAFGCSKFGAAVRARHYMSVGHATKRYAMQNPTQVKTNRFGSN